MDLLEEEDECEDELLDDEDDWGLEEDIWMDEDLRLDDETWFTVESWSWINIIWSPSLIVKFKGAEPERKSFTWKEIKFKNLNYNFSLLEYFSDGSNI